MQMSEPSSTEGCPDGRRQDSGRSTVIGRASSPRVPPSRRRLLLTVGRKRCPFRCRYCFADFSQYDRPPTIDDVEADPELLTGVDVVYPACDVELFALRGWRNVLARAASLQRHVSISTKASLSESDVRDVALVSAQLRDAGLLLKVGISFSTRDRIDVIEPRAPSYGARLATLRALHAHGVATALVLRPLLVDVPTDEYLGILGDARPMTRVLLTGPEHLDSDMGHDRRAPLGGSVRRGSVRWAERVPVWETRFSQHIELVEAAARGLGFWSARSDLDVIDYLAERDARNGAREESPGRIE